MASISANGSKGHHKFTLNVTENGTNISDNTSPVSWSFVLSSLGGGYDWNYSSTVPVSYSVVINGTTYSGNIMKYDGSSTVTVNSGSLTIPHNADGSKAISFSFSVTSLDLSYLTGSASASGTMNLTTIPRASVPSLSSQNFVVGNEVLLYTNRKSTAFTHELFLRRNDDLYYGSLVSGIADGINIANYPAIIDLLYSQNPNGKVWNSCFLLRTWNGNTLVGDNVIWFNATVPESTKPTFTASQITYADTNTSVVAITGNNQNIVQNQSNLKVTFGSATANKYASISKYEIIANGVTKTATASGTVDFGKINTTSNFDVTINVTDSRGFVTTAKKTVTVLAWSPPTLTVSLERLNNYEDETYLTVNASVSSVNNKNTMVIGYRYKESGGEYGERAEIENNTQYTLTCDKTKSYIFRVAVDDVFTATVNEYVLSQGKFPLFIDTQKNAVGINDFPADNEALRVDGGVARFNDGIVLCGDTQNYLIKITDSGTFSITKI